MAASPSSLKLKKNYDVFLSFRNVDVGNNFLSHLYTALDQNGLFTYRDNAELPIGKEISQPFWKTIEESRLAIIVFSENYASSQWCLEEMVKIMECKEENGLIVRTVFYKVKPSNVRHGGESYGIAMAEHESTFGKNFEKVKRWKEALHDASNLAGWCFNDRCPEGELVQLIVKDICTQLTKFDVFLSFRGADVRDFVESLHEALVKRGIVPFMDSESIRKGHSFPRALTEAIAQSRMYVVIFSEQYAESLWCLKELVQILARKNRLMLPVFYKVEPSEVRRQKQSYDKALAKHEIDHGETVKIWRKALTEAANMQGMHLRDGSEDDWIPRIVVEIEKMTAEIKRKLE